MIEEFPAMIVHFSALRERFLWWLWWLLLLVVFAFALTPQVHASVIDDGVREAQEFVHLLFTFDEFDYTRKRRDAWTWVLGVSIVLFWGGMFIFAKSKKPKAATSYLATIGINGWRKLCEGIALIGQTGSGKTTVMSGVLREIFASGAGGLWVTVKEGEPLHAAKVIYNAKRIAKIFTPGKSKCNLFTYELLRPGGSAEALARFLEFADEVMTGGAEQKSDPFWKDALLLTASLAISVVWIAYGVHASFARLRDFLLSAPTHPDQVSPTNANYVNGNCHQTLRMAQELARTPDEIRRVQEAHDFFTRILPASGEKVVGATLLHLIALLAPFMRGAIHDSVNCVDSDILPSDPLKGDIIIMNCPVVENKGNQLFQTLFSQFVIEAVLRRKVTDDSRVVAVVRDELQLVSNPKFDAQAQTIGRSQKLCCVSAFQSLSVLQEAMVDGIKSKQRAMSILGNLGTKLFLSNSDPATMEYFQDLAGKHVRTFVSGSQQKVAGEDILGAGDGFSTGFSTQLAPRKLGSALSNLKTGGPQNGFIVEAFLHNGQRFNGSPVTKIQLRQQL